MMFEKVTPTHDQPNGRYYSSFLHGIISISTFSLASSIDRLSVPLWLMLGAQIQPALDFILLLASLIWFQSEMYCRIYGSPEEQKQHCNSYWSKAYMARIGLVNPIQQLQHVFALRNGNWFCRPTADWWNQGGVENLFVEYDHRNCVDVLSMF